MFCFMHALPRHHLSLVEMFLLFWICLICERHFFVISELKSASQKVGCRCSLTGWIISGGWLLTAAGWLTGPAGFSLGIDLSWERKSGERGLNVRQWCLMRSPWGSLLHAEVMWRCQQTNTNTEYWISPPGSSSSFNICWAQEETWKRASVASTTTNPSFTVLPNAHVIFRWNKCGNEPSEKQRRQSRQPLYALTHL